MNKTGMVASALNPIAWLKAGKRRLAKTEAGQSLVEFAMVLPIFLVLIFGLVDFGRAFYTWMLVTNAAREGARAGAVQLDEPSIQARAYGSVCRTYPTDCSLDITKMAVTADNELGTRGTAVSVNVTYAFSYVTPLGALLALIPGADGDSLATPVISGFSSMRLE